MKGKPDLLNWLIMVFLSLIWGSSFILMKRGLESFNAMQIGSLRIFITFIVLLPVALHHIKRINRNNILSLIIIGAVGNALPAVLFPAAQTRLDSAVAGMLNSLTPLFTLLVGISLFKRKATWHQVAGIILGLTGAAGLLYRGNFTFDVAGLLIVLATFFYGISSNQVTRIKGMNGLVITSLAFLFTGPFAGINLLLTDYSNVAESSEWIRNLGFIIILAVMGSAIALVLFNILIIRTSPLFATTVTYMAPLVSTMWGATDGEIITSSMIISVFCILGGVYLTSRGKRPSLIKAELTNEP
jgi:drug/metabolite transporter (DMT)-like permease